MPRISKIRLVGCKYDGFKKEHENSIYNLTRNIEPDHTLFTLKNGGGKGVMMQLLFQIMMPETRWGKNNGNKVISMFYDQKGRLHPYTLHVLLEWKLDTLPEKWLITGICMKAYKRGTSKNDEEEEKTGLNYFLYTYEHENNGFYTLENIPVYDKDKGESVDYEMFEKFIADNGRDFVRYSQSSVKRLDSNFYEYMRRLGVYKSEWEILKVINKVEGGVGDYFERATDNKAIFDNLILPAISENMKNYDNESDSLKEMFKSNLYITQNLPILLKREGDFRDLIIALNPLIENADIGTKFLDMKERCIIDGNDLYFIIKDEEKNAENEIEKWENEIKKGKAKEEELSFQRANLEYAEVNKEIREIEEKNVELINSINEKQSSIDQLKKENKLYEINRILVDMNMHNDSLEEKLDEKMRLIKALELDDARKRVEELDEIIKEKWNSLKIKWEDISVNYSGYKNYLERKLENKDINRDKVLQVERDLKDIINRFLIKKEELDEEFKKLSSIFDPFSMSFPEKLLEDMKNEFNQKEEKIKELESNIEGKTEDINELKFKKNKIEIEINNKKDKLKELKKLLDDVEKLEIDLKRRICWELGIDSTREEMSPSWIGEKLYKIKELLEEKESRLEELQKNLWENNIDKSLNRDRNYWIPNKDVLNLKEKIIEIGINVQTGMEFLNSLDHEEIENILTINPSFIYGLVIGNEEDWRAIEKSIEKDFLLHSLIPIYLRKNMNKDYDKEFESVHNKGYDFINNQKYMEWINEIDKEYSHIKEAINSIKGGVNNLNRLINDIKNWENNASSFDVLKEISEHENVLKALEREETTIKATIYEEESQLVIIKNTLKVLKIEGEKRKDNLGKLEKYVERTLSLDEEEIIYMENTNKLEEIKIKLKEIDMEIHRIRKRKESNELEFKKWNLEIKEKLKEIKEVLPDARVSLAQSKDLEILAMPSYVISEDAIFIDLNERRALVSDFERKNSQIIVIQKDIDYFQEKIENCRIDLDKIDVLWENYENLNLPLNEINIIIGEIEKKLKAIEKELDSLKSDKDKLSGSLEEKKNSVVKINNKIRKRFNRAPQLWQDLDLLQKNINIENDYKDNEKFLNEAEKILKGINDYKYGLNEYIITLKANKELDFHKGKMNKILKQKVVKNPRAEVEEWFKRYNRIEDDLNREIANGEEYLKAFEDNVETKVHDELLRDRILNEIQKVKVDRFRRNLESFSSMKNHFQIELNTLSSDKEKAEQARNQWSIRASKRVIKIVESLKEMVAGMVYINENNYSFPLVKLKGEEKLPRDEEDVLFLLKEYFVEAIEKVIEENENIEDIDDRKLRELMDDKAIFSKALQGRYPVLMVYKMTEKNEFKYAKPRDYYYTTWEAINKGEGDMPEGSGGQTLSINTFVIMMLMNYRKRHVGNERPWTVLILDNPFGKASAKHILDPVFEIADKLNFQIIAFAAPEIIKVEISERFPVFWELRIGEGAKDSLITGKVMYGGRKRMV
ncbi:hypothetical protein [Clostridium sp. Cult2]|uniref:hypothetical protein n=1 Tax=Clostridium sp. Cult2 TaxID=2079003 RepID=UPI001F2ED37C|nr:hypothetical protein [Clostridium sp. Cult2]MCF6466661.1 hypothetical protein [Clostridium sp. Cult2]